ncbi:type II secretion system minor pseudopilin GspK [Xenophilus sp.]|jgi:general secretion pathway protein K|uniref:type II secretion system minor pseudopilin GspK n=1 Tax=Xenophilus TaxID=151754 RepID=UPI000AFB8794
MKRMHRPSSALSRHQRGAALLLAMLTVTLVATFSAAALWQQWRSTEIEAAERARLQSAWVLVGALDWSRLILREDGRTGGADHLAEPWAVPLAEAKLTSFLAADKNIGSDALEGLPDAFLSGRIVDAQSRLNVRNLVDGGRAVPQAVAAFRKLFELLGLPPSQVDTLVAGLLRASPRTATPAGAEAQPPAGGEDAPLMPQRVQELVWLGLPAASVAAIAPHVTVLPTTGAKLNINTASAEALFASVPKLDLAGARRLVEQRQRRFFRTLAEANELIQSSDAQFTEGLHGVATQYFEVLGRLRLDRTWVEERSLLLRNGLALSVVWRQRGAGTTDELTGP